MIAYPLWAHLVTAFGRPELTLAGLAALLLLVGLLRAGGGRLSRPTVLAVAVVTGLAVHDASTGIPMGLYLPPVLIPAGLCLFFGRSLLSGGTPVIVAFVRDIMHDHSEAKRRYATGLTALWAAVFAALAVEAAALALLAPLPVWSFVIHVVNPALVLALFAAEFAVRCAVFGWPERGLVWVRRLVDTDLRRLG